MAQTPSSSAPRTASLFGSQIPRQLHVDGGVEIAGLIGVIHRRHPMALQPEDLSVLRSSRNFQAQRLADRACRRGFTAEHGRRERHGDASVEILALAVRSSDAARGARAGTGRLIARPTRHARLRRRCGPAIRHRHRPGSGRRRSRVAVVSDGETPRGAMKGVLEVQLDFLLDIAALPRRARPRATPAAPAPGRHRPCCRRRTYGRSRRTDWRRRTSRASLLPSSYGSRHRRLSRHRRRS